MIRQHLLLKYYGFFVVLNQTTLSLIKFVEKSINIYRVNKEVNYENEFHMYVNEAHMVLQILLFFSTNYVKLTMTYFDPGIISVF